MIKSKIGMICTLFLVSGFLLGNGEWKSIIGGVLVGGVGLINFNRLGKEFSK